MIFFSAVFSCFHAIHRHRSVFNIGVGVGLGQVGTGGQDEKGRPTFDEQKLKLCTL